MTTKVNSKLVVYTPAGVGAVATDVQSKLRDFVSVKDFGAVGDGVTDDTDSIQSAIDFCIEKTVSLYIPSGKYKVSKNSNLSGYVNNDQPCLLVRNAKNISIIGHKAEIISGVHGQGVIELWNCKDLEIDGVDFYGYENFPPIDGLTGLAEKGATGKGYSEPGFSSAFVKNNSVDTSSFTGGGYGGAFPREDGSTGPTWGTWGGGFIGNFAYGVLIDHGCENVTIRNSRGRYFNGSHIEVGFLGYRGPNPDGAEINKNIKVVNCLSEDCYNSGVSYANVHGFVLSNHKSIRIGHPEASIDHETMNPGYGVAATRADSYDNAPAIDSAILDSYFDSCMRKGIDTHGGDGHIVSRNTVVDCGSGIHIKTETAKAFSRNTIVADNIIRRCGFSSFALCVSSSANYVIGAQKGHCIVKNNLLIDCTHKVDNQGVLFIEKVDDVIVDGNILKGGHPDLAPVAYIRAGLRNSTNPGQISYGVNVINNIIDDQGVGAIYGARLEQIDNFSILNNIVRVSNPNSYAVRAERVNNIRVDMNDVSLYEGGTAYSIVISSGVFGYGNIKGGETAADNLGGLVVK